MKRRRRTPFVLALVLSLTGLAAQSHARPTPEPTLPHLAQLPHLIDLDVVGAPRLLRGATATFEVRAYLAEDFRKRSLLSPADSPLTARLVRPQTATRDANPRALALALTRDGTAVTLAVPHDLPLGPATLELEAQTVAGPATARIRVEVLDPHRLLIKTDSALVQPGGRLAWRAALLNTHTRAPHPPTTVTASLLDRSGTPRASTTTSTDRFGLASGHLAVPASLRPGDYRLQIKTQAGDHEATQELEVRPFEPQAFFVDIAEATDPERRVARLELTARHADGTPMRHARVSVTDGERDSLGSGLTDEDGRFHLESSAASIAATVVDARGERVTAYHHRRDPAPLAVQLFTAGAQPTAGEHFTFQLATHRNGQPTPTAVDLELFVNGQVASVQRVTSDASGLASATVFLAPRPTLRPRRETMLTITPPASDAVREAFAGIPVLGCLERGALEITLSPAPNDEADPGRARWTVHAVHLPFPERPDFAVALTSKQLLCLELLSHLPARTRTTPNTLKTRISIFETIAVDQDGDELSLELLATSADGLASTRLALRTTPAREAPLEVSPRVASPGERLSIHAPSASSKHEALVLLVDEGAVIAVAPLVDQRASFDVPRTASGLLSVEVLSFDRDSEGHLDTPLIGQAFARPRPLTVTLEHPSTTRPGAALPLSVTVTDGARPGRPVQARLFASVLDERLLALSPEVANTPPLSAWLAKDLTDPLSLDEHATRFAELIRRPDPSPAELSLLTALLSTVPSAQPAAELILPSAVRERAESARLGALRPQVVARAVLEAELALATDTPALESLLEDLPLNEGALEPKRPAHLDPWRRPHTWASARLLVGGYDAESFGIEVTSRRLELLDRFMPRLRGKTLVAPRELSTVLSTPRHLTLDAWGRPLLVVPVGADLVIASAGPDGRHNTDDDLTRSRDEVLHHRTLGYGESGLGFVGYGAGGGGSAHHVATVRMANPELYAAVRERFDTNVLWEAVTTDTSGQHRFEVPLSDSTTTWRVDVEAMTGDGRFGHARSEVRASLPISVDLRLPDALIAGDRFVARALAVNTTTSPRELVLDATAEGLTLGELSPDDTRFLLAPGQSRALALPLFASRPGRARLQLTLSDTSGSPIDSMVKHLEIQDIGQERRLTRRVRLDGRSPATLDTSLPNTSIPPHELTATLTAQRGAPDLALSSLGALLRTPTGCFEQTTAKSWPNLLVLRLLPKDHPLTHKARDLAIAGYERLETFEVSPGQGFALYPGGRPATILTAIGLVQLVDAAAVIDVERPLLERIAMALVHRQSTDGRFRIDSGWHGSEDPFAVTAYAAWSLAEALRAHTRAPDQKLFSEATARALTRSLAKAQRALKQRRGDTGLGAYTEVLAQLAGAPAHNPARSAPEPRTIYSSGPSARVELAALSLLNDTRRAPSSDTQPHLEALMNARVSGGWPTTQATIHALRALAELDTGTPTGQLEHSLAAGQALDPLPLESPTLPTRNLAPAQLAAPLTLRSTSPVLVELDLVWREANAPTRENQGLTVHVEAPARPIKLGQQTTLTVGIHNPSDTPVHLPTAVLELPPGFELDLPALRSLAQGAGHLEHVEVFGRRVELYFDVLPKGAAALVPLTLTATHEAEVTMRPAEAFAYYDPQLRGQSDPLRLTVTP